MAPVQKNLIVRQTVKGKIEVIDFNHITYPDGQQSVQFSPDVLRSTQFELVVRITSMKDMELLYCVVSALRRSQRYTSIELNVLYCIGGRSDRQFDFGYDIYAEDVVGRMIRSLDLQRVKMLDPHSTVIVQASGAEAYFRNVDMVTYLEPVIKQSEMYVLFPDHGAQLRYGFQFRDYNYGYVDKQRAKDGTITKMNFSKIPPKDSYVVVVDDLCDGGATFIKLADDFLLPFGCKDLTLVVTHGLFSKGFGDLLKRYRKIITTNSYQSLTTPVDPRIMVVNAL